MAERVRKPWTLDEFLAFDDGTDTRHELIGGEIVAMTPPARAHVVLAGRLASRIGSALRPPCEVATEAGIVPPRRTDSWYKADVAVTCTPGRPSDPFIAEPVVVVEVLSPSTAVVDRGRKLPDYREIPSVRDILLVSSIEPRIEHWRRTADGWSAQELRGTGAVRLQALGGLTIDLRALYEGVLPDEGPP